VNNARVALAIGLTVVGLAGCTESVVIRPEGELGGDCLRGGRCAEGLDCFRGICVPSEDAGGPTAGRDGGPPPIGPDAGPPPVDPDAGPPPIGPDAGPPPVGGSVIARGSETLVDVFVVPAGVIVVDSSAARLVDPSGAELARFSPGREITAAAFDGSTLGVADRSILTLLESDLSPLAEGFLTEWCASAVIVGGRFVCGPSNDWDRIFYSHDLATAAEVARSGGDTYNGIPMTAVPGEDFFVTVTTGLSPSDFHLYEAPATGAARYVGESPYHGDFAVRNIFAFIGDPATHLVTHEGLLLEIFRGACRAGMTSRTDCFTRDGDLGSLRSGERYVAMAQSATHVYGIAGTGTWFGDPPCMMGCELHEVEPSTRVVSRRVAYSSPFIEAVRLRVDGAGGLVFGAHTAGDRRDGFTAYEVRQLTF